MGTPGVLGFIIRGKRRGTYNRWDGYPIGLGQQIVKFILSLTEEDILQMIEMLDKIEWVSLVDIVPAETLAFYTADGTFSADKSKITWYELLLPYQYGRFLRPVLEGKFKHLNDNDLTKNLDSGPYEYYIDFEQRILIVDIHGSDSRSIKFEDLTKRTMREIGRLDNPEYESESSDRSEYTS